MKTIRSYGNSAEANFARSLLESAGVQASLADELAFTMEPPLVPWGIRLQVPEEEASRALEILDQGSTFAPLEEGFVPPASEQDEVLTPLRDKEMGRWAFVEGGFYGVLVYGAWRLLVFAFSPHDPNPPHYDPFDDGIDLLPWHVAFCLGGVIDLGARAVRQRSRRLRLPPS